MSTRPNLDAVSQNDRLDSWKEIAAYLGRSERTVRRWEEREALPVHRLAHEKRGSIYAYRSELDSWRASRKQLLEANAPEPDAPDATPSAERELEQIPNPSRRVHSRSMLWAIAGVAAALMVLLVWQNTGDWRHRLLASVHPSQIRSIAVLPLDNLSGDPEQEYFADGMTDALITNLAQISSLKVTSRTSVMGYKGTRKRLQDIARELNVDGIVEGAVLRSGDQVRVNAKLIEASTDRHLWANMYNRNLSDVIALQNELAQGITNEIQVKLTPEEQARQRRRESVDWQTYDLYVKGRYFVEKAEPASILRGIDYYQQATQRDPKYAAAYAAIAWAYGQGTGLSHGEQCLKMRDMAGRALLLDEGLADAHHALAFRLFHCDWDWADAEKEYQRAIALNPNDAQTHQGYGQLLATMKRQNWATEVQRALELNPVSLLEAGGGWYLDSGQYDLFIERQRQRLELDPDFPNAYVALGRVYTLKGMYEEAIRYRQKAVDLSERAPGPLSALAYTYGVSGKRKEALKILQELTLLSKRRYVSPENMVLVYVGLGEKDRAFDCLQKAVVDRSIWPPYLRSRELESIRSDPRWAELLRGIGLPP
jgi:TolB-like protein/Flp pilus assembly protein TadD